MTTVTARNIMDQVLEPRIPKCKARWSPEELARGPSQGTRGARKNRGESNNKQKPTAAGPSQGSKAIHKARGKGAKVARKARAKFRHEQSQNLRWVRAQRDISMTTKGELERYFTHNITNQESMEGATQPLSDEGQALMQRLQAERREALSSKIGRGCLKDWFTKRGTLKPKRKGEIPHDLELLMDRKSFKKAANKRRRRNKVSKRMDNELKRSKAGEGAEKAGGDIVGRDAVEHTESLAHVIHGIDEMCLGGD